MAANPLEKLPQLPPASTPPAPKQHKPEPQSAAATSRNTPPSAPKGRVAPVSSKPKVAEPRVVKTQPEIRRAEIADQVTITARKDQGKFGHTQPPTTPAPEPAASLPPAKPGEAPQKAPRPRHAINIVG